MLAIMSEFTTLIYHSTWFISFFYSIRLEFQLNFHVSRTPDWNIFTSGFIGEWKHSKKLFEYSCLRKRIYFYVACCCTPNIFRVGLLAMLERKDSSHVLLWSRKVQSLSFSFLFYKFSLWEILSIGFSIKYLFEIPPEPFSLPGGWKFIMFFICSLYSYINSGSTVLWSHWSPFRFYVVDEFVANNFWGFLWNGNSWRQSSHVSWY